jgi:hypothetical protein
MSKHIISIEQLETFESKQQIAGYFGRDEYKALNIYTKVTIANKINSKFTVEHRYNEVLETDDLKEAIEQYNSL